MLQNQTPDSAIAVFRSQDAVRSLSAEAVYVRYVPSRPSVSVSVDHISTSTTTICTRSVVNIVCHSMIHLFHNWLCWLLISFVCPDPVL